MPANGSGHAVPVLYKTVLFGVLVMLFSVAEHLIGAWLHHLGWVGGLREMFFSRTGAS